MDPFSGHSFASRIFCESPPGRRKYLFFAKPFCAVIMRIIRLTRICTCMPLLRMDMKVCPTNNLSQTYAYSQVNRWAIWWETCCSGEGGYAYEKGYSAEQPQTCAWFVLFIEINCITYLSFDRSQNGAFVIAMGNWCWSMSGAVRVRMKMGMTPDERHWVYLTFFPVHYDATTQFGCNFLFTHVSRQDATQKYLCTCGVTHVLS